MSDSLSNSKLTSPRTPLLYLQYGVYGLAILYFGRDIFIPLAIAALISFVLYPFCKWMERKGVGRITAIVIGITLLMLVLFSLVGLFAKQFFEFLNVWPTFQAKLTAFLRQLSDFMVDSHGISREQQGRWMTKLVDETAGNVFNILTTALSFSAVSVVMLVLIPIYALLILYYRRLWVEVLYRIFPGQQKEDIQKILSLTIDTYYNFIKGMGLVYLIVGILNSIGLLLLGVPHAILFGLVASILTFIPYVGIMVGALLPIAMAWITYDSIWYPVGIVGIFTFVQYLEANVIFPWAVSSKLNVNTMVVLIAIFAGGLLWGVAGMILFVPFVGILKLLADHNPQLKTLAMALGTQSQ